MAHSIPSRACRLRGLTAVRTSKASNNQHESVPMLSQSCTQLYLTCVQAVWAHFTIAPRRPGRQTQEICRQLVFRHLPSKLR
eukprot:1156204-Pelagomonas_calceolata.AAC.14